MPPAGPGVWLVWGPPRNVPLAVMPRGRWKAEHRPRKAPRSASLRRAIVVLKARSFRARALLLGVARACGAGNAHVTSAQATPM